MQNQDVMATPKTAWGSLILALTGWVIFTFNINPLFSNPTASRSMALSGIVIAVSVIAAFSVRLPSTNKVVRAALLLAGTLLGVGMMPLMLAFVVLTHYGRS